MTRVIMLTEVAQVFFGTQLVICYFQLFIDIVNACFIGYVCSLNDAPAAASVT